VRFLVDAQLPPALARWLVEQGHEASHLVDHGLLESPDSLIWAEAERLGAVIVSKDEDFVHLCTLSPQGPSLVWVRVGNTTRRDLLTWFAQLLPTIEQALAAGERLVEVAPGGDACANPEPKP
jgi:predicted nuclease of predicted toxin-antitoxin system